MANRLVALSVLLFSPFAVAEAPFEDISFPEAVKKAESDKKVVMIDFYTTWCPPCKMLDSRTWPDKRVQKWLGDHAVCIKVDAEASREFAARFKVRAYPTIVFVKPDGTILEQLVGYRSPKDFVDAAEGALSGKDPLTRAREAFEAGDMNDPMRRDDFAGKLVELEENSEALKHYLWCFDHGEQYDKAYSGVRVSFLLGDIERLAQTYPPAREALITRRDKAESQIRDYVAGNEIKALQQEQKKGLGGLVDRLTGFQLPPIVQAARDLSALNDTLHANDRTIEMYDKLKSCDRPGSDSARHFMFNRISAELLAARRYEDVVRDGDPVRDTSFKFEMMTMEKDHYKNMDEQMARSMLDRARNRAVSGAAQNYEACVGADRMELADQIKKQILDFETSYVTYDVLINGAVRAERYDLIKALGDEAKTRLEKEDAERIARRVEDELASPDAKAANMRQARTQESEAVVKPTP